MSDNKYSKIGGVLCDESVDKQCENYNNAVKLADGLLSATTLDEMAIIFSPYNSDELARLVEYMDSKYVESFYSGCYTINSGSNRIIYAGSVFSKATMLNCYDVYVDLYKMMDCDRTEVRNSGFHGAYGECLAIDAVKSSTPDDFRICKFLIYNDIVSFAGFYHPVKDYNRPYLWACIKEAYPDDYHEYVENMNN